MPIRQEIQVSQPMPLRRAPKGYFAHAPLWVLIVVVATAFSSGVAASAQDTTKPQGAPPASTAPASAPLPDAPSKVPGVALYNQLDRKSIVFPDIATNSGRLSTGGKFQLFVNNSISVHTVMWAALGSAIGQAENSPTGFGQGWDAYGSRFGTSMARQASAEFFGTFILASALHEDPRFYPEVNPTFFHAIKYSVQRVFITRNDDGRDVANISGLVGPAMGEGLANVYWPDRNRTVGDTFFRYGLDLTTKVGGNMLREYWPVFYGKMHHKSTTTAGH
jgi:hypothetical protein